MLKKSASDDIAELDLNTIDDALDAIARGECVVVMDDCSRESEGNLVMAAQYTSPEALAFIVRHTTGVVCVAIDDARADALDLPLMTSHNSSWMRSAFTVSVDYRHGASTGVSAVDRARTIRALSDADTKPSDFARPGHIFPIRARANGVLERPRRTEAAVDLMKLAGCSPAGVLCEMTNDDGTMSRLPDLVELARSHALKIITVADLIQYRNTEENRGNVRTSADAAAGRVVRGDGAKAGAEDHIWWLGLVP